MQIRAFFTLKMEAESSYKILLHYIPLHARSVLLLHTPSDHSVIQTDRL
jgi:hypothetical protein